MGTGCIRIFLKDALFFHFGRTTDVNILDTVSNLVENGSCRCQYKSHVNIYWVRFCLLA